MSIVPRTVLLGSFWIVSAEIRMKLLKNSILLFTTAGRGSRVAHRVFLTLFPVRWRNSRPGKVHPRAACRPVKLLLGALLGDCCKYKAQ